MKSPSYQELRALNHILYRVPEFHSYRVTQVYKDAMFMDKQGNPIIHANSVPQLIRYAKTYLEPLIIEMEEL